MARPYKYTAKEFKQKFEQYKEWLKDQSFQRPELIKSGEKAGQTINVIIPSPPDQVSFCLFCGIEKQTFYNYCSEETKEANPELFNISTHARNWIESQQLRGAMAGVYNPAITARIQGLSDNKTEIIGNGSTINVSIGGNKISSDDML